MLVEDFKDIRKRTVDTARTTGRHYCKISFYILMLKIQDSLIFNFYSTKNIADIIYVKRFIQLVSASFNFSSFYLVWVDANSDQQIRINYEQAHQSFLEDRWRTGAIAFAGFSPDEWEGGGTWRNYKRKNFQNEFQIHGRQQNQFTLRLPSWYASDSDKRKRIVEVADGLYNLLSPNFGLVRHYRSRLPSGIQGWEGGLVELYWLNYFGPKYVQMLGEENLIDAPAPETRKLQKGGVFIRASDEPIDPWEQRWQKYEDPIIERIGKQYFVKIDRYNPSNAKGDNFSIFNIPKMIRLLRGMYRTSKKDLDPKISESGAAVVAPTLDWTDMLID